MRYLILTVFLLAAAFGCKKEEGDPLDAAPAQVAEDVQAAPVEADVVADVPAAVSPVEAPAAASPAAPVSPTAP